MPSKINKPKGLTKGKRHYDTKEAAVVLGLTRSWTMSLVRRGSTANGRKKATPEGNYLKADKVPVKKGEMGYNSHGYIWKIPASELKRFAQQIKGRSNRGIKKTPSK